MNCFIDGQHHRPPCPACRATKHVRLTMVTDKGSYCRCERCGDIWHADRMALTSSRHDPDVRVKPI